MRKTSKVESSDWADPFVPKSSSSAPVLKPEVAAWTNPPFPENRSVSLIERFSIEQIALRSVDITRRQIDILMRLSQNLGFWLPENSPPACHMWNVDSRSITQLSDFPPKIPHAGNYEWVGKEEQGRPKWLWDSRLLRTVPTANLTDEELAKGYVAISYTWGRWKVGEKKEEGTEWCLPVVDPLKCAFNLSKLKRILADIPCTRYFWVDVLCINQGNSEEMHQEISKQGQIFAAAKGVLVYLWSLESGDELAHALYDLGDRLLAAVRISSPEDREHADYRGLDHSKSNPMADKLRADPWFTSLWTLQEMILFPASIWITRNGEFCTINDRIATTTSVASACAILQQSEPGWWLMIHIWDDVGYPNEHKEWVAERRAEGNGIKDVNVEWLEWAANQSALVCSLSASRRALLLAAAKRAATKQRGEAILAAMKIAKHKTAFRDERGLAPGGIPIALINKILEAEGRWLFWADHKDPGTDPRFFTDILPTTASACETLDTFEEYNTLPTDGWSIAAEGSVRIPHGSIMQLIVDDNPILVLQGLTDEENRTIIRRPLNKGNVIQYVKDWYKLWIEARGIKLGIDMVNETDRFPKDLRVMFLPLGIMNHGPDEAGTQPYATGIVLVSSSEGKQYESHAPWYKCGTYQSRYQKTYKLRWRNGIRVGKVGPLQGKSDD